MYHHHFKAITFDIIYSTKYSFLFLKLNYLPGNFCRCLRPIQQKSKRIL